MNQYLVFGIGFLAQILFSARLLVQWITSERAGKVLSPVLFWQLSIIASFLLIFYGILRKDIVIIAGQTITYSIYLRNLHYHKYWQRIPHLFRKVVVLFPFLALLWIYLSENYTFGNILLNKEIPLKLLVWGLAGQIVFTFRFVYQWLCMEKVKESILPFGFWVISIAGSLMVISYAIFRRDPVLFIGQLFGFIVYGRNILIHLKKNKSSI
jgi:lipid-A-disaccharide synthase-like uncharacterized protein